MSTTPLPTPLGVRELFEGLLGREVVGEVTTVAVDPHKHPGAMVGVYVDDDLKLRAVILMDLSLTAFAGAALALLGVQAARDVLKRELLSPSLYDNAAEVLNVAASLLNGEDTPHVRLYEAYAPREGLPGDVERFLLCRPRRLDMQFSVAGYGDGRISVLTF